MKHAPAFSRIKSRRQTFDDIDRKTLFKVVAVNQSLSPILGLAPDSKQKSFLVKNGSPTKDGTSNESLMQSILSSVNELNSEIMLAKNAELQKRFKQT